MAPPARRLSLDGRWQLGQVPPRPTGGQDDRSQVAAWLPATVPGHVHADLMAAGRLPDLYVAGHLAQSEWVDGSDWWLVREVDVAHAPGERLFLHFDRVDYLAEIWWDAQRLRAHEGAIAPLTVEIPPGAAGSGPHRLGVRLQGADGWPAPAWQWWERLLALPSRQLHRASGALRPFHPRLRRLRPPVQAGWDFAPALAAIGLGGPVTLERLTGPRLTDLRLAPWQRNGSTARSEGTVTLDRPAPEGAEVTISWRPTDGGPEGAQTLPVAAGVTTVTFPLRIGSARWWHPWEQGAQSLYDLRVDLRAPDGSHAVIERRMGLRTIRWDGWRLSVNGAPFFVRGVNWVPVDILPATVPIDRYRALLERARAAGVNLLRVWGGGGRERPCFYDLCDELGLLLWQEFPFACTFLDHYPRDPTFQGHAEREARGMVRVLRHHPSIVRWGAGNEFSARRNRRLIQRLQRVVHEEAGEVCGPPSPAPGDRHEWHVWHGRAPLTRLRAIRDPFLSEFGLQALPARDSLRRFLPAEALWPPHPLWRTHNADLAKLATYVPVEDQRDLDSYIAASQHAQAAAVQQGVERMRRRKGAGAGGVAIWQWNEPWPAISWALVDYYGVPKEAARSLAMWYAPLLISLDLPPLEAPSAGQRVAARLWLVNDLATPFPRCEARVNQGGRTLWATPVEAAPFSARAVADLAVTLLDGHTPLEVELWHAGRRLAHNRTPLTLPGPRRAPRWQSVRRAVAALLLK